MQPGGLPTEPAPRLLSALMVDGSKLDKKQRNHFANFATKHQMKDSNSFSSCATEARRTDEEAPNQGRRAAASRVGEQGSRAGEQGRAAG